MTYPPRTFTLTENHIKLLRQMYVRWDDSCYDGAPAIGIKRPYGNSDVAGDVAEILGISLGDEDGESERSEEAVEKALLIHRETEVALQIVLSTGNFKPGEYYRPKEYNTQTWLHVEVG